ncbi:nitronate monooxygenase [Yinghuangia sp. YIM S09857]|uniref:nitronate monooxygenase n=1 Tax=Yinghuangia sp. YIM S09857 TaxID=3436929 RepID=UPI003F531B1C
MAGGAGSVALAAAVCGAGGLGFLAAGYKTAAAMSAEIADLRTATGLPFGVNLFLPGEASGSAVPEQVAAYRVQLEQETVRLGAALGSVPPHGLDDDWDAKIAALLAAPVPVVSFTFGCPDAGLLAEFRARGTTTAVTVTTPSEAERAAAAGCALLVVQGGEAGGHQGRWENADSEPYGLLTLLALVQAVTDVPCVAAGGIMTGGQIAAVRAAGAVAAQLGTAFLRCPESGAPEPYKAALADGRYERTRLTRAFSGRPARGLVNGFLARHTAHAPAAYPEVHYATAPLRRASAEAGDPEAMALWAGQGWRLADEAPAATVVERLTDELAAAEGH